MRFPVLFAFVFWLSCSIDVSGIAERPGYSLVKSVFENLRQPDWRLAGTVDSLIYQKGNFTNQHRKEYLVLAPVYVKYQEKPKTIALLFYTEMLKEIDENGNLKFWESHWTPTKWWTHADSIKTHDKNRDGVIELEINRSYNVESRSFELYELITLRQEKVHPLFSNVSWQAMYGTGKYRNFLMEDTLLVRKKVTYVSESDQLMIIESISTEIVQGMEPNGELIPEPSRGIKTYVYDPVDLVFKLHEVVASKPLIAAAPLSNYDQFLAAYEIYKADKYRCSTIASYLASSIKDNNTTAFGPENLVDTDLNSCWKEGAEGSGYNEWFEFQFRPLPNVDPEKDLPFTGFYVINGDLRDSLSYYKSPRIRSLLLYLNENPALMLELSDSPEGQILDLTKVLSFSTGQLNYNDKLKIKVLEVYGENKNGDASLSEFIPFCLF